MKKTLLTLAALALLLLPAMAEAAQGRPGGYASVFLGMSMMEDTDATTNGFDPIQQLPFNFNDEIEFDPGVYVGGTLGYDFRGVRLEGELSYRQNDMDSITELSLGQVAGVEGDVGVFAVMANAFLDFHNDSPVTPYIGGGIGVATVYLSETVGDGNILYDEDDDSVFAYQIGGGLGIALNRQTTLDLGYRYFGTETANFSTPGFQTVKFDTESHNFAVGLRLKF